MRVSIVNTASRGGAAAAALRLHFGLRAIGVESSFLLRRGATDVDQGIYCVQGKLAGALSAVATHIGLKAARGLDKSPRTAVVPACELFSDCRSGYGAALKLRAADVDVVNLHWVSKFVDLPTILNELGGRVPIVWTLHDMQPLTGGCHYSAGCEAFTTHCHTCPQLVNSGLHDASAEIFEARLAALETLSSNDLHIACPSKWLLEEVARSRALSRFPRHHIPNGLDTSQFRPMDQRDARRALGLPTDVPILLFVAEAVQNRRKGLDLLLNSLATVKQHDPDVQLVAVGKGGAADETAKSLGIIQLGSLQQVQTLAMAYAAADLFVIPSRQDNLPNTTLESLACGTPVVGFNVGGIPDVVRPSLTGWLAQQLTADALAHALTEALVAMRDQHTADAYRRRCREIATAEFDLAVQANRYRNLFARLHSAAQGRRASSVVSAAAA